MDKSALQKIIVSMHDTMKNIPASERAEFLFKGKKRTLPITTDREWRKTSEEALWDRVENMDRDFMLALEQLATKGLDTFNGDELLDPATREKVRRSLRDSAHSLEMAILQDRLERRDKEFKIRTCCICMAIASGIAFIVSVLALIF